MTPVDRTFAAQPPIGPWGVIIAKGLILALFYWLGYSLIYALTTMTLAVLGPYAEYVRWGLIVAWWVFATWWISRADLNNP